VAPKSKYTADEWLQVGLRKPKGTGRRVGGVSTKRAGYPALFNGTSSATKLLVEIAAKEPARRCDLEENEIRLRGSINLGIRRLEAQGLVRRYMARRTHRLAQLMFNRSHPLWTPIRSLLAAIAESNGLDFPKAPAQLPSFAEIAPRGSTATLRIYGHEPDPIYTLFGSERRTIKILAVATVGVVDQSTLARLAGHNTTNEIACAIKPLVADRIFVSEFVGNLTVFSLPKEPWANELRELAAAICKRDNRLAGELRALRTMMISGVYRAPMKRRLERYESLGI